MQWIPSLRFRLWGLQKGSEAAQVGESGLVGVILKMGSVKGSKDLVKWTGVYDIGDTTSSSGAGGVFSGSSVASGIVAQ